MGQTFTFVKRPHQFGCKPETVSAMIIQITLMPTWNVALQKMQDPDYPGIIAFGQSHWPSNSFENFKQNQHKNTEWF